MDDKRILIVDDEPNNLQLLRQILKEDYSLVFAKNGLEALSAVEKHKPDLILLDIMMPEMDGYETCRRLKESSETESIPVIFVTAMSDIRDEFRGFEAGAVDYIVKPLSAPVVRARVKTHLSLVRVKVLEKSQRDAVFMLGEAGHFNDDDTGVHIWRMASYCSLLAARLGWNENRCSLMELAAPMHDTGKIGIPDAILKKPGKLTPDEWVVMKGHSRIGMEILSHSSTPLFTLAAEIAYSHHEKWNGSGYPKGLREEEIPESARIVAVADVFDALTMKRPYKEAWPTEEAIEEIKRLSGNHLEPRIVEAFLDILPVILKEKELWKKRKQDY